MRGKKCSILSEVDMQAVSTRSAQSLGMRGHKSMFPDVGHVVVALGIPWEAGKSSCFQP